MNYIKITKDNVNLAHEIEQQIFPEYDSLNNYLDSFKADAKGEYYLIEDKGEYVGIIDLYYYNDYPDDAWLGWFGFLEPFRHQGRGKEAIAFFENLALSKVFKYARLFTDTFNNDNTKDFYKAQGYFEDRYINYQDPASLKYPISIFSKSLNEEVCPLWDNRDIHFTKQVEKQQ